MVDQLVDDNGYAVNLGFLSTSGTQLLNGTLGSAATSAFSVRTAVLVSAPESFHMAIGVSPTATTSSPYFPAGLYEVAITQGASVAVIKSSAAVAGNVWVTPYA